MKQIRWNVLKSDRLKKTRGVSFEEILKAKLLGVLKHPSRANQSILAYEYKGYLWAVPYVAGGGVLFLKTIYPSRKLTKRYRKGGFSHEKGEAH
ncbi:MAG: toxin [Candidatus Omnitrophica bacterium]|nr:toxin [Candidatus Omnitrophota bacterium]